jgi:hypothetical protein
VRIFARKVGLLSSKSFSDAEKSSYDCAEYKIEGETYKTTSRSNLKVLLRRWHLASSSMKMLAFRATLTKYGPKNITRK